MKIELIKYKTPKGMILEGYFIQVRKDKFIPIFFDKAVTVELEVLKRDEVDFDCFGKVI